MIFFMKNMCFSVFMTKQKRIFFNSSLFLGVQLVYQRPATHPAGDNPTGRERSAAVHHFPPGNSSPLTPVAPVGRGPRPRVWRKGGRHELQKNILLLYDT
jgi:hypothetical protein